MNRPMIALGAYLAAAVVTFGHAAAEAERLEVIEYQACLRRDGACFRGAPGLNGFWAAALWPLYWSWEAFE